MEYDRRSRGGGDGAFSFLATTDTFIGVAGGFLAFIFLLHCCCWPLIFIFSLSSLHSTFFFIVCCFDSTAVAIKDRLYVWILICTKNVFSKYNETNAANAQFLDAKLGVAVPSCSST